MSGASGTLLAMVCPKCGSTEFYGSSPSTCKPCVRARSKARYEAKKPEILAQMGEYQRRPEVKARRSAAYLASTEPKSCPRCGTPKARVQRRRYCDACRAEIRAVDPDPRRSWEKRNPERAREIAAREREKNAERYRESARARNAADPERNRARVRAWQKENPDRVRAAHRKAALNRRARKLTNFIEDVDPTLVYKMHGGQCGICGEFIEGDFHVDHRIPLARGGAHGYVNVQPAHPRCNMVKGAALCT